ncbi:MAG: hypothetical protein WD039_05465, partial [Xanthobacteraceae bacterium]
GIRFSSKVILAKIEAVYATDPVPTGAANALLMTDVTIAPMEGDSVSRNLARPYMGAQEEFAVGLHMVLSGSTELVGSGSAGVAPAWGPLARACGLAEVIAADTSVAYNPVSESHESISLYFWIGATRHVLKGCRGTAVLTITAQGIPVIRWTFTGLYAEPSEVAQAAPTLTSWQRPVVATKTNTPTFTVGGVAMVLRNFELDLACSVERRLLIGKEEILIVDRAESIAAQVEAVPLTTFNPFAKASDMSNLAVSIVHGTVAGHISNIAAPTCQMQRPTGYENQQNILEWPLRLTPKPSAGNDQFTLTLT